jgi:hypothetical protein
MGLREKYIKNPENASTYLVGSKVPTLYFFQLSRGKLLLRSGEEEFTPNQNKVSEILSP